MRLESAGILTYSVLASFLLYSFKNKGVSSQETYIIGRLDEQAEFSYQIEYLLNSNDGRVFNDGRAVYVKSYFNSQNVNNDSPFTLNLTNQNSQFGVDVFNIKNMYYHDKILTEGQDFYVNYTTSSSVDHSIFRESSFNPKFKENYFAECLYKTNPIKFTTSKLLEFNYNLVTRFRTGSFATKDDSPGIFYITYSKGSPVVVNIATYLSNSDYNPNLTFFSKLWVIDQPYESNTYLVGLNNLEEKLYFFELIMSNYGELFKIYYRTTILIGTDLKGILINKVGYVEDNFILGTSYGLIVYQKIPNPPSQTAETVASSSSSSNNTVIAPDTQSYQYKQIRRIYLFNTPDASVEILNVGDFCVLKYTIYILAKGYGVKLIDKVSLGYVENIEFIHTKMQSFDLVVNPILNTKYVGITISEDPEFDEFYLELVASDEMKPQINKILSSSANVTTSTYSSQDLFFGSIYNAYTNEIIMIRRGLVNSIPFQTYKLNVSDLISSDSPKDLFLTTFYSVEDSLSKLVLVDPVSNRAMIFDSIELPYDELSCLLSKPGNYNITMEKYGEACKSSIDEDYAYAYCDYVIYASYMSIGPDMTDLTSLGIILGSLCGFLVLVFLLFLTFKTQCCTDFSVFTRSKKNAPSREELYKDKEGFLVRVVDTNRNLNATNISKSHNLNDNSGVKSSRFGAFN